jgi:hypothetical protein
MESRRSAYIRGQWPVMNLHQPPASLGANGSNGQTAVVRQARVGVGFLGCCGRSFRLIQGQASDRTWPGPEIHPAEVSGGNRCTAAKVDLRMKNPLRMTGME